MKSSTIRRSTLSRESMEVIENLAKEQSEQGFLSEYVRPGDTGSNENANNTQELDLLWQNFKNTQFNTNSPTAYILLGFIIGVLVTALSIGITGYSIFKSHNGTVTIEKLVSSPTNSDMTYEESEETTEEIDNKVNIPTDETSGETTNADIVNIDSSKTKKYIVKSGDTGESIIKHFYGSYTPERAEQIIKINNLKNLDHINIDQELLIPVEQ